MEQDNYYNTITTLAKRFGELDAKVTDNSIRVKGVLFQKRKLYKDFILNIPEFYDLIKTDRITELLEQLNYSQTKTYLIDAFDHFTKLQRTQVYHDPRSELRDKLMATKTIYIDVKNGDKFLWDSTNNQVSEIAVDALLSQYPKKIQNELLSEIFLAKRVFDPFKGLARMWRFEVEGVEITHLNTYRPPIWYDSEEIGRNIESKTEEYPELFNKLLVHLFPDPEEREIVLDWATLACFDIPISFFSMRSMRGNGKSVFKYILFHLVGNFYDAQEKILAEFNADMRNKRIIGLDDNTKVGSYSGHRIRKFMLNPTMSMNEKIVQTHESESVYFSLIICSNLSDKFYLEYDERRLVCPSMGNTKLEEAFDKDSMNFFRGMCNTDVKPDHVKFLRQIGQSLLVRFHNRNPDVNLQLRSGHFWEDVVNSLASFYRYTVLQIFTMKKSNQRALVYYDELKEHYKLEEGGLGKVPHWGTFSRWLISGFSYQGMPVVLKNEDIQVLDRTFMPNPELVGLYAPSDDSNEEQMEEMC